MYGALALLALAAVVVAQAPPTPQIPENFYAEVDLEYHFSNGVTLFGNGRWAVDPSNNVGVEDYEFQDNRGQFWYNFDLERYDLGKVFTINSYDANDCNVTDVTGNMPSTWSWVALATYTGKVYYRNYYFDTWTYSTAGVNLVVGVAPPNYNTPVFLSQNGTGFELFIHFNNFYPSSTFNPEFFTVPPACNHTTPRVKATPTRPNISEVFEAETRVEIYENGTTVYGQGILASDQPAGKFVEHYDLEPTDSRDVLHVLNLRRFDLGEVYLIESSNYSDCKSKAVTGSMPAFWNWLAAATFVGQRYVRDYGLLDVWNYIVGGVNLTLAVDDRFPNYPLFLARETTQFSVHYDFVRFTDDTPNEHDFDVPQECN